MSETEPIDDSLNKNIIFIFLNKDVSFHQKNVKYL